MSEENKKTTQEKQEAPKKEEKVKTTDKKTSKKEESVEINIDADLKDEKEKKEEKVNALTEDLLADLPESIRKKLEQRKGSDKKAKKGKKKAKKKAIKKVSVGKVFIKATYNNTIITITDLEGNTVGWASTGMAGFKGPKKSTSYAAQVITKIALEKIKDSGLKKVSVFVKGVGTGRESVIRTLNSCGIEISMIRDVTPMPHNGCRAKKPRRV